MSLPGIEKYYINLDTKYSDEVSEDYTKHTWYLKNLLNHARLKNVVSAKIYTFTSNYSSTNMILKDRLTILFDELLGGFMHQDRRFQFIAELSGNNKPNNFREFYAKFDLPFNDGVIRFNNPIKILDKLTVSIADPFETVPIINYLNITDGRILQSVPDRIFIISNDYFYQRNDYNASRFKIIGLTSDNPADDMIIAYLTNPDGLVLKPLVIPMFPPAVMFPVSISGTIQGNLSPFIVKVMYYGLAINLELTCLKYAANPIVNKAETTESSYLVKVNINENYFVKLYNVYVALNSQQANRIKFSTLSWQLNYSNISVPYYASTNKPLNDIVGMRFHPIIKPFSFSDDNLDRNDVHLIYVKEFGNECFINKSKNIRFHFSLRRIQKLVSQHYELTTEGSNSGYYWFNKPISAITTITLDSYQRHAVNDTNVVEPVDILAQSASVSSITNTGGYLFVSITTFTVLGDAGDTLQIANYRNDNIDKSLLDQINNPSGYIITERIGANTYKIDTGIVSDPILPILDTDPPIAIFTKKTTVLFMEFILKK